MPARRTDGPGWVRRSRGYATARLTQREAAAAAGLSRIYLQKLEAGERAPSPAKLDDLLATLGSGREELEGLLSARPWTAAPARRAVRSRAPARHPAGFA